MDELYEEEKGLETEAVKVREIPPENIVVVVGGQKIHHDVRDCRHIQIVMRELVLDETVHALYFGVYPGVESYAIRCAYQFRRELKGKDCKSPELVAMVPDTVDEMPFESVRLIRAADRAVELRREVTAANRYEGMHHYHIDLAALAAPENPSQKPGRVVAFVYPGMGPGRAMTVSDIAAGMGARVTQVRLSPPPPPVPAKVKRRRKN